MPKHSEGLNPPENPADGDTWTSPGMRVPHRYHDGFWIPSQGELPSQPIPDVPAGSNAA